MLSNKTWINFKIALQGFRICYQIKHRLIFTKLFRAYNGGRYNGGQGTSSDSTSTKIVVVVGEVPNKIVGPTLQFLV